MTQPLNETIVSCEKQHVIHPLVSLLGALVLRGGWEDGLFVEVDGARAVEILDHFMVFFFFLLEFFFIFLFWFLLSLFACSFY